MVCFYLTLSYTTVNPLEFEREGEREENKHIRAYFLAHNNKPNHMHPLKFSQLLSSILLYKSNYLSPHVQYTPELMSSK